MSQLSLIEEPTGSDPLAGTADSDEWYTPNWLFDQLNDEFSFTLDACATEQSAKCERFWTKADDGLARPWGPYRVWLNPPYSDIGPWAAKAHQETKYLGCELVVALLPAWMDRKWWHRSVEPDRRAGNVELRFLEGRLRFSSPLGPGEHNASFPSLLVIWRRTP